MLGLDVHFVSKESLSIDSTSLENSQVILCIISRSFSIHEFKGMLSNVAAHHSKVLYVSYGPHPTNESTSKPCFKMEVNFEESELQKAEFKSMVSEVVCALNKGRDEIMEATIFPVSLKERVEEMWAKMSSYFSGRNKAVQCFGLLGMGGVGKTTTALSIYNTIQKQFEGSFFSLNTRARVTADPSSLVSLQKEILQSLLSKTKYGDGRLRMHGKELLLSSRTDSIEDEVHGNTLLSSELNGINTLAFLRSSNEGHGNALLSCKLRGINAFVVLDDVDSIAQLEALYNPLCSSLGPNSLVLITSRDRKILEHAQSRHIFDIKVLNKKSSQRLFKWHAFLKPEAPPHLIEVSENVIDACNGLPLSLKVMGAHLYRERDLDYWNGSLKCLKENEKDIFSVLRRSLDGLESNQRDSFLDISCFFVGYSDVICRAYLEGVYGVGWTHLKVLNNRCLLTFEKEEGNCDTKQRSIGMHDQLRDMGRHIVRKEEKNRAWDEESARDVLKDERTRSALRGLSINSAVTLPYEAVTCASLPQLSFLRVVDDSHDGESLHGSNCAGNVLQNVRCEELRLLGWRNAPFRELPPGLASMNLRVLDLRDSRISQLPARAAFMNLRYLDLAATNISSVPSEIFSINLQYMDLSRTKINELPRDVDCPNLRRLYLSDTEISQVPHGLYSTILEILDLSGTNISEVPEADFPNLLELDMKGCKGLKRLPPTFGASMPFLQYLDMEECECLEALDSSIGKLTDLRQLWLSDCHRLTRLPEEMTRLQSLEQLGLVECTSLETLSFLPTTLQKLWLSRCSSLQTVNASLPNLQHFSSQFCTNLKTPPTELGACMRELCLMQCGGLKEFFAGNQASFFGELSCLEFLELQDCTYLETLSVLPTTLQKLYLHGCSSLQTINAALPNLQVLNVNYCRNLKTLPTRLGARIRELSLCECESLYEWLATNQASFFGEFPCLEFLDLQRWKYLDTLSFLPTTLQKLWLNGCSSLQTVNAPLPNLQQLHAQQCTNLKSLPTELGGSMQELCLRGCDGLPQLLATNHESCFGEISCLEFLDLQECTSLETLSFLPATLQKLWLNGCSSLQTINASLPNLRELYAAGCTNLKTIPTELGACMRELALKGCAGLYESLATNEASFFGELSCLAFLDLQGWTSLETLSFLPTTLQKLWLNGCRSLQTLNASLPNLRELHAAGCTNLKTIPTELGACMRELGLKGCAGLYEWLATNEASFFGELPCLEFLDLREWTSLETLSFLPTTLEKLSLNLCSSLQTVNASLPKLREISALGCINLKTLPTELGACMRELYLGGCRNLKTLPTELGACMQELFLVGCDGLYEWLATNQASFFKGLCSLKMLNLSACTCLKTLSSLPTTLERLVLIGCTQPEFVDLGSDSFTNLKRLDIRGCPRLRSLPPEIESR
ncbi:hypothetical protein KP509_38G012100 [Ceratopteris richardii]|uniref:AAA+ ATPase domain-containing protein n=1 Tax=Ceratopteris richardii TaxID=49495 RepID=A0A8T2Q1W5_CERRI|nr:hypothetical protein KP509_38G012100 [Ceratopteris richardii]